MTAQNFWTGKKVFLTGHTGFKGAWLAAWLAHRGAKIHGYALPPETTPNLCDLIALETQIEFTHADIRDLPTLTKTIKNFAPEIVFHLAAQSLVRRGYAQPIETFATNVIGTANVLDTIRQTPSVRAALIITSDKCYENHESPRPYRETDPLGGADPYSASKACAEILTAAYRHAFFNESAAPAIATARAGNVIGGGDFSPDRLIPDCMTALLHNRPIELRNPTSTRPWQHVLDPLHGYLLLAEKLVSEGQRFANPYNLGPPPGDAVQVHKIVESLGIPWIKAANPGPHEAAQLAVDSTRAQQHLNWRPHLPLKTALTWTAAWYAAHHRGENPKTLVTQQIIEFQNLITNHPSLRAKQSNPETRHTPSPSTAPSP